MPDLDPNCRFALQVEEKLNANALIDEVCSKSWVASWLVTKLARLNKPFKIFNLGAGVKRITTDTDTCPCCKRKI